MGLGLRLSFPRPSFPPRKYVKAVDDSGFKVNECKKLKEVYIRSCRRVWGFKRLGV